MSNRHLPADMPEPPADEPRMPPRRQRSSNKVVEVQRQSYASLEARLMSDGPLYTMLLVFILTNAVLFTYGVVLEAKQHHNLQRYTTVIARGSGFMLNLDLALLLLVASRSFITFLRSTHLNMLIPFDALMPSAHILLGYTCLVATITHATFHLVPGIILRLWTPGFLQWTYAVSTGFVIEAVFVIMVIFARPVIRRASFENFLHVHLVGAALFLPLLCFHGSLFGKLYTWKWIVPFLILYTLDRMYRKFREWRVCVRIGDSDPSAYSNRTVTKFVIPKCIHYKAGQWAELCIPQISEFQWHPFTIASAPSEEHMTFYIKAAGDWTKSLGLLLSEKSNGTLEENPNPFEQDPSPAREVTCHIRGPYGAPAEHVGQFDKVVLISGGVGGTPYLSVVKDIVQYLEDEQNPFRRVISLVSNDSARHLLQDGQHASSSSTLNPESDDDEHSGPSLQHSTNDPSLPNLEHDSPPKGCIILPGSLTVSTTERLYNSVSSTTMAFLVLWFAIIRFFLTALAFATNQDMHIHSLQGLQTLPFGFQIVDLVLASLVAVPTTLLILFEFFYVPEITSLKYKLVDALVVFPVLVSPVLFDAVCLGASDRYGHSAFQAIYYYFLWPATALVVIYRHVRNRAGTTVLAAKRRNSYDNIRSVDFIYTTPDATSDDWLVADLKEFADAKHFHLHRYVTRETEDVEKGPEYIGKFKSNYGRPDWDSVIETLVRNTTSGSSIGVFFCGPRPMEVAVRGACLDAMIRSRRRGMQYGAGTGRSRTSDNPHTARGCNIRLALRVERFSY